jgi:hypothetical protein
MQISRLPARTGWRWVLDGFRILRRQPIGLLAIAFVNLVLMWLSVQIPVIGSLGPLILTPLLMVGLMKAAALAERGQNPSPLVLFAAWRDDQGRAWRPLLVLGLINAVTTLIAMALSALAGGETLINLITGRIAPDDPTLQDGRLLMAALVFLLAYLPVQLATWYAPMFIAWDQVPLLKSLFFSIAAIFRNKGAFLVYAVGWMLVATAASIVIRLAQLMLTDVPMLMSMLLSPLWLIGLTAVYCSFWATYRDAVDLKRIDPPTQTPQ